MALKQTKAGPRSFVTPVLAICAFIAAVIGMVYETHFTKHVKIFQQLLYLHLYMI